MSLILDLGCGHKPNPKASVFLDKYLEGNKERAKPITKVPDNFVVGDAEQLPFADKVFDYCYCSQMLEHAARPELALLEIERIAKAGIIKTPHMFNELTVGKPFHYWLVIKKGDKIIFLEKEEKENLPFKRMLVKPIYGVDGVKTMAKNAGLIDCVYRWVDKIFFVVIYKDGITFNKLEETENEQESKIL